MFYSHRVAPTQLAKGQMLVAAAIEPVHIEREARLEQARRFDDAAKRIAVGPRVGRIDELREGPAVPRLALDQPQVGEDRKSTRLNSSQQCATRMPSSA